MPRLDQERQERLEPKRMESCLKELRERGYTATAVSHNEIHIWHNNTTIKFWPYSGWHSGKGIKDGRGFQNLLNELRQTKLEDNIVTNDHGKMTYPKKDGEITIAEIPSHLANDVDRGWGYAKWWHKLFRYRTYYFVRNSRLYANSKRKGWYKP